MLILLHSAQAQMLYTQKVAGSSPASPTKTPSRTRPPLSEPRQPGGGPARRRRTARATSPFDFVPHSAILDTQKQPPSATALNIPSARKSPASDGQSPKPATSRITEKTFFANNHTIKGRLRPLRGQVLGGAVRVDGDAGLA